MNIINIVSEYVSTDDATGALMINGDWGIGKSVYWRNKIVPALEQLTNPITKNKYKCLYVSLNGITSTHDIIKQLQLEKLPDSKASSLLKARGLTIFKGIGLLINREKLTEAILSEAFESLADFSDNVICFDDLERNTIQENIMGYICTQFVERKNCKVVLIGDEARISKSENYYRIKEKLIARTIRFDQNLVGLTDILNRYSHQPVYLQLLKTSQAYIQTVLDDNNNKNLRTLIFALDAMRTVCHSIEGIEGKENKELVKSLLFFILLISFEYKEGILKSEDSNDYKLLDKLTQPEYGIHLSETFRNKLNQTKRPDKIDEDIQEEKPYEVNFYKKYEIGVHPEYYFFGSLYQYLLSGDFQPDLLKEEIKSFEIFRDKRDNPTTPQASVYNALRYNYQIKSEQVLKDSFEQFLTYAKAGAYAYTEYGAIYSMIQYLSEWDLVNIDPLEVKNDILEGCKKSMTQTHIDIDYLQIEEVQRIAGEDPDFNPLITNQIMEQKKMLLENRIRGYVESFRSEEKQNEQQLNTNPFEFLSVREVFEISQYSPVSNEKIRNYFAIVIKYNQWNEVIAYKNSFQELLELLKNASSSLPAGLLKYGNRVMTGQLTRISENLQDITNRNQNNQ